MTLKHTHNHTVTHMPMVSLLSLSPPPPRPATAQTTCHPTPHRSLTSPAVCQMRLRRNTSWTQLHQSCQRHQRPGQQRNATHPLVSGWGRGFWRGGVAENGWWKGLNWLSLVLHQNVPVLAMAAMPLHVVSYLPLLPHPPRPLRTPVNHRQGVVVQHQV